MSLNLLTRRHIQIGILLASLAFCLRALFVLLYPASSLAGGDPIAFWSYAQGVVNGQGFHSSVEPWLADRPPLYSYFVASIMLITGESRMSVFLIQAFVGAISVMLFYWVGVRAFGSTRGLIAGLIMLFFPHLFLITKQILTEPVYLPLIVLLLACLLLPVSLARIWTWIAVGLCIGLLALARREAALPAILVTLLVGGWRLWPKFGLALKAAAVVSFVAFLTLVPWLWRNQQVFGIPLLSSSGGWNFMVGNNPDAHGSYTPPPAAWQAAFQGLDELARDRKAWELSLTWIQSNPSKFAALLPAKIASLYGKSGNLVVDLSDLVLIPFYIIGLIRAYRRRPGWPIIVTVTLPFVLTNLLVGLIFVGGWRYRLVIYPGLFWLAAYGIPERWIAALPRYNADVLRRLKLPDRSKGGI